MVEMPRYPFMAHRKGSRNLYYKRPIPKALQTPYRGKQIWRSLGTDDKQVAKVAYRKNDQEIDELFEQWRRADQRPEEMLKLPDPQSDKSYVTPLTPALIRRLTDEHYVQIFENDFEWRGKLWRSAKQDEDAFWQGALVQLPGNNWHDSEYRLPRTVRLGEKPGLEEVLLGAIFFTRKRRRNELRQLYHLGDRSGHLAVAEELLASRSLVLSKSDRSRLERKLMEVEIKALEDIMAGDEQTFDAVVEHRSEIPSLTQASTATLAPLILLMPNTIATYARASSTNVYRILH
jgi:hypothetical protein